VDQEKFAQKKKRQQESQNRDQSYLEKKGGKLRAREKNESLLSDEFGLSGRKTIPEMAGETRPGEPQGTSSSEIRKDSQRVVRGGHEKETL